MIFYIKRREGKKKVKKVQAIVRRAQPAERTNTGEHREQVNGGRKVFRAFMKFSPALENSRDGSRHIFRRGRTLGVGSAINVSPDPAPCSSRWRQTPKGKPLLTLNNKSGRSFVSPRAFSEYPTA